MTPTRFHNSGRRLLATGSAISVAVLALVSSLLTPHSSLSFVDRADDLPDIRRVLLRPEQLPAELDRVRRGVLRQMPLDQFDALLARAADAGAALRDPPRLLQANYRATLGGESLTGSASWSIVHRHSTPGLLSLEPLNLALRAAAWDDGSPALLGDLDVRPQAPGLELFVGRPGEQRLNLVWSARGVPEPAGLRFDLRMPACPVAVLDLELPADREPVVARGDGLLTGPITGTRADRRVWRLAFAGAPQIDLVVRPIGNAQRPLILSRQRTRQDVSPGQTECEFTFDLEVPNGGVRHLTLECDPTLRPTEVVARNLERWEVQAGTDEDELTRVAVLFREPLQSGSVTLRAVGPATPGRPWASPAAAVVGAVPRGEAVVVRLHPDLHLSDWRSGPFRLVESTVTPDRWQVLTLQAGLIRTGPSRPAAWLRPAGADYRVRENLWWLAAAERMTLTAQLSIEVVRGPLYQIPLQIPAGWEVERVETDPPDLLAGTTPDGQRLLVDLQKALGTGAALRVRIELVRRSQRPDQPTDPIPLPDVVPINARNREGALAVRIGPGLQSAAADLAAADPQSPADRAPALWGDAAADYVIPLRAAPASGTIRIWPRSTQVRARAVTTLTFTGARADLVSRLRLEPATGSADAVVLNVSNTTEPWDWEVVQGANRVRSVQRLDVPPPAVLSALAANSPWAALAAVGVPSVGQSAWWRVALARPLTEPIELEAHAAVPLNDRGCLAPLVRVPGAAGEDHQVTFDLRSSPGWRAASVGLADLPTANGSPAYGSYRYGAGPAALALVPDHGEKTSVVDRSCLVTYATDPTRLVHRLSFRLWNWDGQTVPIDLPVDAVLRQARVNGLAALPLSAVIEAAALHVELPASGGPRSLTVDVVYTTHGADGRLFAQFACAAPGLPSGARVRHIWCLAPDVVPLQLEHWRWLPLIETAAAANRGLENSDQPALDNLQSLPSVNAGLTAGEDGLVPADLARGRYWEPANAKTPPATICVVRPWVMGLTGALLALSGLALAWATRLTAQRRQWAGLLAWIGLASAAVIWLPAPLAGAARWPLLAAVLVAGWRLLPARPRPDPATVIAPRSSAAARGLTAVLLGMIWLGSAGYAAAPTSTTVYLVPGSADASRPTTVLAPPDLLDRLIALARRGPAGLEGVAWIDAQYDGRVVGAQARFTAVFRLHSFADDPAPVLFPLAGVQLGDAKLDGGPAFLRASGDRYLIPIHGRGSHTLEVSFAVACPPSGDEREMRFGIPEIVNSRMTFTAPAVATNLQTLSWRGALQVEIESGRPQLDVDLGRVGTVQVRWRVASATPRAATVNVQETYLWDLTESAARLLAALRFAIGPGSVTSLSVGLPNSVEVAAVGARSLDSQPAGIAAGWLRSWHVAEPAIKSGQRSLVLEFAAPIEGRWQVNLELVPREPFGASFALPFPSAVGIRSSPPVFAWRTQGVDLTDVPPNGANPVTPEVFLRDNWLPSKIEADPRPPTRAYQRAAAGPAPALRLKAIVGTSEGVTADIEWQIGPGLAEVDATARFVNPDRRASLLEWIVPAAITITEVSGSDIHAWSRTGPRLQVWLTRPAAEAVIHVAGTVKRPSEAGRFDLPPIRPRGTLTGGTVQVAARDGLAIAPLEAINLTDVAPGIDRDRACYSIDGPQPYRAAFDVRIAVGTPETMPLAEKQTNNQRQKLNAPPPKTTGSPVRIELANVEVAGGDDGRWINRATIMVTQATAADLRAVWPTPVRLVAIDLDGLTIPPSDRPTGTVTVPSAAGGHRLQLVWLADAADSPPVRPEQPILLAGDQPVPAGPMLWTVSAPAGLKPAPDAPPLPAAATALYRAAAEVRLADANRSTSPEAAKAARARAAIELRRAEDTVVNAAELPAGPGGITLTAWRQQIREALRPGTGAISVPETVDDLPYDDAFVRGTSLCWYIPAGEEGPRLAWLALQPEWPMRLMRITVVVLAGVFGVWWGRRFGANAWPEQLMLLGAAAWAAEGSAAWLLPALVGVVSRFACLAQMALKRWRPEPAAAPSANESAS